MPASDALAPGPTPTPCTFILWTVACATSHCLSISPLPSPSAHVLPGTSASHAHIHGPRRGRVSSPGVAYHSHRIVRRLVIARSPPAPVSLAISPPSTICITSHTSHRLRALWPPPPAIPLSHRAIFAKRRAPTTPHPNLITLTVCCFSLAAVYEYDSHPGVPRGTMLRAPRFRSLPLKSLVSTHTCRISLGLLHASTAHALITHPSTLYSSLLHMQYAPLSRRAHSNIIRGFLSPHLQRDLPD